MSTKADKAKAILGAVAPVVGGVFGGPAGALAGRVIAQALGKPDDAPEEELVDAIVAATPQQLLDLKNADLEFKKFLKENDLRIEEIHAADRASARARNIALRDRTPSVLAGAVVFGFFAILIWMLKYGLPERGDEVLLVMVGALGAAFGSIISFYFGSSSSSRAKDDTIAALKKP